MNRGLVVVLIGLLIVLLATAGFVGRGHLFAAPDSTGTDCTASNPCGSIQQAVDFTSAGHLILVGSGTYIENIVVIQEALESLNVDNVIQANTVTGSGSDGIQIQGDRNLVRANRVTESGSYGIHLCGPDARPTCVSPGTDAVAENNVVTANQFQDNASGAIVNGGAGNIVNQPAFDK